jgi:hypothetical protein
MFEVEKPPAVSHRALIALGILTILSTIVFRSLRSGDGDDVSLHKVLHPGG